MPIPNRYYEAVRGWSSSVLGGIAESNRYYPITEKIRQVDFHGGFTAAAGHALYTARNYPQEYWNRTAFVCEPTGHLVATFVIRPDGAGFRSKNAFNLVASDDEWSAPIMAEIGPDGNVWILDWYNYIVQHNPTPQGFRTGKGAAYETDLRDKKHGRIYRLVYVGQASRLPHKESSSAGETPAPLTDATPEQLVETLKSDNMFWRLQAQRLLVEGKCVSVAKELYKASSSEEPPKGHFAAVHAMWTLRGIADATQATNDSDLGAAAYFQLEHAFDHASPAVRRNAILVSARDKFMTSRILKADLLYDRDPQVRLAALLALAESPKEADASAALAKLLGEPAIQSDRWLLDGLTAAAAAQSDRFLAEAAIPERQALSAPAAIDRLTIVANHVARSGLDEPAALLNELKQAQPEVATAIVTGLTRGWPRDQRPELTPELETALGELFEKLPPAGKSQLVSLATRWNSQGLGKHIEKISAAFLADASNEELAEAARLAAANQYVSLLAADPAPAKLLDLITPQTSPELARGLVEALAKSESPDVGAALAGRLPTLTPTVRPAALQALLGRSEWTLALLDALEKGGVQIADLSLDQKTALANHPSRRIADRAKRLLAAGGGLPNPDRQKVYDDLLPLTKVKGDPEAGKVVFKNQCAKCHTHAGEGAKIGPDLTGAAVHPKHELLVHLVDPSRNVEGNFRVYTVLTLDGTVINGLLASESKTAIELIDSEAKKHVVLREDIDNLKASTKSLMPEGFEKQVKPEEITNLLEFLTQRGQFVPMPLEKYASITSARGMFYDENSQQERLVFSDWSPKTFEGVPFTLVDPEDGKRANAILLFGPQGKLPPTMPKSVSLPYSGPAKAIHLLSGVGGWAYPYAQEKTVSLIVRLHYEDGQTEDHKLLNGEHFADYIRRVDVPGSKFAFQLRNAQLRYLSVIPQRAEPLAKIELVKGDDGTAPLVMAVTVESK
jgi:putative heme-binding domain-containing protein